MLRYVTFPLTPNLSGSLNASWAASSLDAFSRAQAESLSVTNFYLQAKGYAAGAGTVSLTLDGSPLGAYYDPARTNGLWLADMAVPSGSHTLKATAVHQLGTYTNSATNTFTVLAKAGSVTNVYDAAGNVTLRSFPGGRVQSLAWDAAGRLLKVLDRNTTDDGYDWTATYDALGRRLRTTFQTVTNDVAQTNSLLVTVSYFDPMVEFQELAVSVNGQRTWKVYGPDLNGFYGGLQGVGGLEATIRESDGVATGLVNDAFGHVVATLTMDGLLWSPTKVNGYGPLPGFEPLVLTTNVSLAEATVWRGKRIDPTGLYWLGARYYDPADARFISTDPYGLGSDPSLYAAFGGDPVNYFDPDGRLAKKGLDFSAAVDDPYTHAIQTGVFNGLVDFGMPLTKGLPRMLPGGALYGGLFDSTFDSFHGAINDGINAHTANFSETQGYLYAGGGLFGEVGPNFIPIAGVESAMASAAAKLGPWAAKYTPTFLRWGQTDLRLAAQNGVSWLNRTAPGLNPANYSLSAGWKSGNMYTGFFPEYVGPSAAKNAPRFVNQFPAHEVTVPIQTFRPEQVTANFSRRINYVVTERGNLIMGRQARRVGGGHIDLAGGEPVLAAGEAHFVHGKLRYIDNSSGHYLPTGPEAQAAAVKAFEDAGIPASGLYVEKVWNGSAWVPK